MMKQMSHEKTQPLQNFVFLPLQLSSEHDNALAVSETLQYNTLYNVDIINCNDQGILVMRMYILPI